MTNKAIHVLIARTLVWEPKQFLMDLHAAVIVLQVDTY
jgi:hypothetical protein